ncbi:MAG TPA: 3-dehydroquinate synthase [Dictyoglomaceae bacterium]|nr:3-dehydroquinate synthase [Dictyoglomaceae bacterium]
MEELVVNLSHKSYPIFIGRNILKEVGSHISNYSSAFIITHQFLRDIYGKDLLIPSANFIDVPVGEKSKSFREVISVIKKLVNLGADRKSAILAFGGGVIGDLSGFVASIYMRGIDYFQIPTTLLSQVDSSIGGKAGIDIPEGKNLVGTFYHPNAVFIDLETLDTLPEREYRSGLAEVVKYGIIMDSDFFDYIDRNLDAIIDRDKEILQFIIKRSLECKKFVVEKDEREQNLRMILNFGHTLGHAIEAKGRFKRFLHGEAIAIGMKLASELSFNLGYCDAEVPKRIESLLERLGFNLENPYSIKTLVSYILRDKKAFMGKLRFILSTKIGEVKIVDTLTIEDVIGGLKEGDTYGK